MASQPRASITPDDDHRYAYMAAIIATTVVAVLIAWVRMYTRFYISRNIWFNDWVMFVATFLTIGTNGVLVEAYNLGLGRHIGYVPAGQIKRCFMFLWIAEPTNLFALYAVRLSITLFFLRLIPKHKTFYRRIIFGIIWSLTISDIYVSINYFIQCRPVQKVWDTTIEGTCLNSAAYQAAPWLYQAVSILADLALVSIPVMMFRSLQLPMKAKIGVIILCCLGVLLEICVGMMCGSLPCIKPLYMRLRYGHTMAQSASSGSYQLSDKVQVANKGGKPNAIYRYHNIEFSSGPAVPPRPESEDAILPRTLNYGLVVARVHGPSALGRSVTDGETV